MGRPKKTTATLSEGLEKKIENIAASVAKAAAEVAKEEISKQYPEILNKYYNSYRPLVYDRIDQLRNNSFIPYSELSSNGLVSFGGVKRTPENMHHYNIPHKIKRSPGQFFETDIDEYYLEGWHGTYDGSYVPKIEAASLVRDVADRIINGDLRKKVFSQIDMRV